MAQHKKFNLKDLDIVSKALVIAVVIIGAFILVFILLHNFMDTELQAQGMRGMMEASERDITYRHTLVMSVSLFAAAVIALFASIFMKTEKRMEGMEKHVEVLNAVKKVLSEDEKLVVNEVQKAGEITQDSLRFRLNWSKAKISTILGHLDRSNVIQRERQGKTYLIRLEKGK